VRRYYMREMTGLPPIEDQEKALRSVGLVFEKNAPIYIDRKPKRAVKGTIPTPELILAFRSLRPGDELVIACASVLGGTRVSVLNALQEIGKRQASVLDVGANTTVAYVPEALAMIAFAERAESQMRVAVLKKARLRKVELGAVGGKPAALEGKALEDARARWADPTLTAKEAAVASGVSESTMRRLFKKKGTPIFGRPAVEKKTK
jgi:DNA invertase Pin-like site-specific DNA recombinase